MATDANTAAQPDNVDTWHDPGARQGKGDPWMGGKGSWRTGGTQVQPDRQKGGKGNSWASGGTQVQPEPQEASQTRADRQAQSSSLNSASSTGWNLVDDNGAAAADDGGVAAQASDSNGQPPEQQDEQQAQWTAYPQSDRQSDWWAHDSRSSWEQTQAEDQWMRSMVDTNNRSSDAS